MEQLSFGTIVTDPDRFRLDAMRKTRRCLSCSDDFASSGPGNRICGGCKDHDIWRSNAVDFSISTAAF